MCHDQMQSQANGSLPLYLNLLYTYLCRHEQKCWRLQDPLQGFCNSRRFDIFIAIVTLINAATLALDSPDNGETMVSLTSPMDDMLA